MVNIPPLPPLLCSTPPPIDFGEDDEDVDVLTPPDDVDNAFGDFLNEDDTKTTEPLPVSIYDGLIPAEEIDLTNHVVTASLPPADDKISKDSKTITKPINLTEALNFNIRNTNVVSSKEAENVYNRLEAESCKCGTNSQNVCSKDRNIEDLTIESLNTETKSNISKTDKPCMRNMVSIEDIIDDLSDDELYSPKTPKNFVETHNSNDYFKIEEIKTPNIAGNERKIDIKNVDSQSSDFLDNNESTSLENDNEFKSFSSNSFIQNTFDTPPPLQDNANSIDEEDDFGDFADFQETNFANDTVPVNDLNIRQHNHLESNDFNNFNKYNTTEDCANINTANKCNSGSEHLHQFKNSDERDKEFNDFTFNISTLSDKCEVKQEQIPNQTALNLERIPQEISDNKNETSSTAKEICEDNIGVLTVNKTDQSIGEFSHIDNSFAHFNPALEINDDDNFGNFAEFSNPPDYKNNNVKVTEHIEEPTKCSKENFNNSDGFDDFADFEYHQEVTKLDAKSSSSCEVNEYVDNEDDDFGDFNTADPITPAASSVTHNKTSQNATTETSALPPKMFNECISKILQLMFDPVKDPVTESSVELKTNKIQDIPFTSIDTAKALEYQWMLSDTRHSFIRSLGIDSRNIMYGDSWNPSLPRFAANLSFNPLKPMKPVQPASSTENSSSALQPIPIRASEMTQTLELPCSTKMDTLDLNWKSSSLAERAIEAFKDNAPIMTSTRITSMPYIPNEAPTTEPVSLTILESNLDNEDTFLKTPPISEMESIATFSSPLPTATMNIELSTSQIARNVDDFDLKEIEENLESTRNINEVVVTSTFTGSFKETHIYTPPKTNNFEMKHATTPASTSSDSPTKISPIDFDYEKAAMGVIIDETVVKKEYRDVEYNPPFSMESLSKSATSKTDMFETSNYTNTNTTMLYSTDIKTSLKDVAAQEEQESNDDFSEFQSVSSEVAVSAAVSIPRAKNALEVPKTTTVSHGGMILSPAILIPQAISMQNQKPKIEWGDCAATINPEELARIEELFPEPKSLKSSNSSQKSTPTHQMSSTPSISATVANKELEGNINDDDDDDWSEFVSVTITNNTATDRAGANNNILAKSPDGSAFKQRSPVVSQRMPPTTHSNSNYDDEWSEFVSSAPPSQQPGAYKIPQFNSGAWQNANFYNNPLSMYHKGPLNIPTTTASTHSAQKYLYNNNNNYNISQQPYQIANNVPAVMLGINRPTPNNAYQQIHVMQNFSTAPVPTPERLSAAAYASKNNQFQSIGSAKVAPSIALIPDLGFVAPAVPTHTSFINSLPKPSINMKK